MSPNDVSNFILFVTIGIIILLIFIPIGIALILANKTKVTTKLRTKNLSEITDSDIAKMTPSERNRLQNDVYNHIAEMMTEDFRKIGWTNWNPDIHATPEQLDRIKRASDSYNGIQLRKYSPNTTTGIIRGSSCKIYLTCGNGCSCPDFRKRGLPCKHMYFIAMNHNEYKSVLSEYDFVPYSAEDNTLYGLNFCILGRNQAAVKEYIHKHAGTFGQNSWWNISAVIVNGETQSQKLISAQENRVIVMTFDDLRSFCDDIKSIESMYHMEKS